MRVKPLPKSWLIHTITYEEYIDKDDWGNPIYDDPIEIKHVRFDNSTVFSRDSTQKKVLADGIVFVDTTNSKPIPDKFIEESRITFNNRTYKLEKIVDCYYPNKNEIRHYELEVI